MVNPPKSKCQLRLEARSIAYQQKQKQNQPPTPTTSNTNSNAANSNATITPTSSTNSSFAARIQRATEARGLRQRQRRADASARVVHAKRVAAETWAKRRAATSQSRAATQKKLAVAHARRQESRLKLQETCKRRVEAVLEKVESLKEIQRFREDRQRRAIEAQLVDAARRREEQTMKMKRRLSQRWQSVETVKDRVQRAKFIQRWYRRHVDARQAARQLQGVQAHVETLVTSWDKVATSKFDDSIMLMQQRELMRAAQYVLRVLLPTAASTTGSPTMNGGSPKSKSAAPFRVLLMVGMLAAHPSEIMENNKCDRLAFAAKTVLRDMQRLHACLKGGEDVAARALKASVAQLEARFAFYFDCFSQWKDRDAERLALEMLRSYHDIYRTKLHYSKQEVDHEDDGMHQLIDQTNKQLVQLRSAIAQVIGKEDALERIAVIEASCSSGGKESDEEMEMEPSPQKPKDVKKAVAIPVQRTSPRSSTEPPRQVEPLLADEKLVHELILNPSFRLPTMSDSNASENLQARVRTSMVKAFWDQAVTANDVNLLLVHLEELRVLFNGVVKSRTDLVDQVNSALHAPAMRALLMNASAHFPELRSRCVAVLQTVRQAEAPARNASTDEFLSSFNGWCAKLMNNDSSAPSPIRILVDFVAFSLDKVEQIRADGVNAHLGVLATYLSRHGVEYEQKKFQEKLTNGVEFPATEKWLLLEISDQLPRLSAEKRASLNAFNAAAFSEVFRASMMALVTKYIDGKAGVWPETFALDSDRIRGFRDACDRITLISTMLIVVQDFAMRRRLPVTREFFTRLGKDLSDLLTSPGVSGGHLVARAIDELKRLQGEFSADDGEFQQLPQRLQASFQAGNPVFSLFSSRVAAALQSTVLSDRGEWEMHASLAPFEAELRGLAREVHKLFKHNEVVHASLYNAVLKKALSSTPQ